MASDDRLIRNGIKYSDQLFKTILQRIEPAVYDSETYEEFLERTAPYTVENPMLTLGADEHAVDSVLLSVAGNEYSYEANRKLTEQSIRDTTSDLVTNVGEDVKQVIRDTMQKGFKENKLRQDIMKDLTRNVEAINNTRAKTIYRTEIKRAQTISNYISAKERGANAFYCNCNDPCPICDEQYDGGGPDSEVYSMEDDMDMLPPVHPNCRCSAVFIKDDSIESDDKDTDTDINIGEDGTDSNDAKIKELEQRIADERALADKWHSRGNTSLAETFESNAASLEVELNKLKKPATKVIKEPSTPKVNVDSVVNDVLKKYGVDTSKTETKTKTKTKTEKKSETKPVEEVKTVNLKEHLTNELPKEFGFDAIDYIEKKVRQRGSAKGEYGQIFDFKTGRTHSPEFKGGRNAVQIKEEDWIKSPKQMTRKEQIDAIKHPEKYKKSYIDKSNNLATQHNHPNTGSHAPSGRDIYTHLTSTWEKYGLQISERETWIIQKEKKINMIDAKEAEKQCDKMWKRSGREAMKTVNQKYPELKRQEAMAKEWELQNEYYGQALKKYFNGNKQYGLEIKQIRY